MKEWPKYFLQVASKYGVAYWKFKDSQDAGEYFYHHLLTGHHKIENSVWSLQNMDRFKQVSEEEIVLLLLGGDNALS